MAKQTVKVLLAAASLLVPATAFGAGFQNTSQSATATSMANAVTANKDEPNTTFYNPAMMTQHPGLRIWVGDTIIIPGTTYTPDGDVATDQDTINTKSQVFPPPNANIQYRFNENMAAGVGLTFPYGLGIAWADDWVGRENIQSQSLQTANITPAFAYEIPNTNLSIAAGGQIVLGAVEFRQSVALPNDQFVDAQLGGSGLGFGGVGALFYEPIENLSIGLNYRSRVKVNFDNGKAHFEGEEDTPLNTTFQDNPGSTAITTPDSFALGVAYRLDKLHVEADVNYTLWQTYDKLVLDIDTGGDDDALDSLEIVNNWHNAFAFRLGASYDVTDSLPVRLGLAYDMSPIPDDTVNASLPGNDRINASIGTGYTFKGFRADIGYQLVVALSRDIQNERAPNGEYQTTAHVIGINAGYGF